MAKAKKAHLVKASVLNAASDEKGANFYVIAAAEPEVDKKVALASFGCKTCATHFSALAGSQPFCVTCGSEDVDAEEGDDALSADDLADDDELANVECSSCGAHNIVTLETAAAFGTNMHCITCGTEIEYMPPAEGEDVEVDVDDVDLEEAAEDEDESLDLDEGDLTLNDDEEEEVSAEVDDAVDEAETEVEEDEGEGDMSDSDMEEATLAALVQGDLSVERLGDRIVASIAGIPVAHLTREMAGENAGVFAASAFTNAIAHTARQVGAEKALSHYKFELATVKFPIQTIVQARVQTGVEDAKKEIATRIKDISADLNQAIAIAAAGLNKGWFKGQTHVLKDAFKTELSAAGFTGSQRVVDKVFSQYNDSYHRALFEKAAELLAKPVEIRNEIASAIGDMTYQIASDEMEDESESDLDATPTEARLEGAGLRSRGGKSVANANLEVASLRDTVVDFRTRNGGRLF